MGGSRPCEPLEPGWVIVDGLPMFHRAFVHPAPGARPIVHVHGFGISGTYLEPTAAVLARRHSCFVPDLPGMGRSIRPDGRLDLPGLTRALIAYCDAVGIGRATFVGNSLGCPLIVELAAAYPDRIDHAVMVSPAGGPNNQPLGRALAQMAVDAFREPVGMLPIAVRDYLHFGLIAGFSLFRAMTRYPTLERLRLLGVPTLVVAGERDPLVRVERAHVFTGLPVSCVLVPGAHALNFSAPDLIGSLVDAFLDGEPLVTADGTRSVVRPIHVPEAMPDRRSLRTGQ